MTKITYNASIQSIQEENQATFYLMNTTPNRNKWAVSDKALQEALPTLNGKNIGCGPDYNIDKHYPDPMKVGTFMNASKPNGYAQGTATITDQTAWSKLVEGEWGPVSVVITSYLERCSYCRADLTNESDPFTHSCIAQGQAHLEIQSFVFNRVDFVDIPAYPQAGYLNQAQAKNSVPLELLASLYNESTAQRNQNERENKMSIEQLQQEKTDLEQQLENEKTAKAETLEQLNNLKANLQKQAIEKVLEARTKAGLVQDPETERETLTKYTAEFLDHLKQDAETIIKTKQSQPNNPKTKNTGQGEPTHLEAAMDEARTRLFGRKLE